MFVLLLVAVGKAFGFSGISLGCIFSLALALFFSASALAAASTTLSFSLDGLVGAFMGGLGKVFVFVGVLNTSVVVAPCCGSGTVLSSSLGLSLTAAVAEVESFSPFSFFLTF